MASVGDRKECEWIDRIISEGAVPLLEPDNCSNGWATPPGDAFMVRGPEYFTTRVKVPAGDYLLKPLGFDWIKSSVKIGEILKDPDSRVRRVIDNEFPAADKPFVWAFNIQVPGKDNYSAIAYFTTKEPVVEDSLMDRFLKGDNAFRNSRLKLIANIVKGPWIVRKAVGEQAICVIGRALSCKYCTGENFIEVDIDIGSSMVASAIVHLAFGYISTLTVDLAFLIESQVESELPEKILGAFRFSDLDPASARTVEPSAVVNCDDVQTSLPTRLWKSIGQGFSHILHSGPQEDGSSSGSQHAKIVVDHKDNPTDVKNCTFVMRHSKVSPNAASDESPHVVHNPQLDHGGWSRRGREFCESRRAFLNSYHLSLERNKNGSFKEKLKRSVRDVNEAAMGVVLGMHRRVSKRRVRIRVFRVKMSSQSMVLVTMRCFIPWLNKNDIM
ncbi:unnamed protein product [Sphenostylis stenocarpa]|uniref:Protein ENHANCED DISEASE RESISTANCE 2 C-terminal domain-containing protein n=1 Tax=Sphenostylis stenocarpa TaxID=92480 RepID=A0AA86VL21_9FABA|nr:unnamed protein product [Sphenostylis stenocarpa]